MNDDNWLSTADVARALGTDVASVRRMIDNGQLVAHFGSVHQGELNRYLRHWGSAVRARR